MNYEQALEELKKYNQAHLLVGYNELTEGQKRELLESISSIDLKQAIEETVNGDTNTVNFIIGSFYIYGTVNDIIKELKK